MKKSGAEIVEPIRASLQRSIAMKCETCSDSIRHMNSYLDQVEVQIDLLTSERNGAAKIILLMTDEIEVYRSMNAGLEAQLHKALEAVDTVGAPAGDAPEWACKDGLGPIES